MGKIELDHTGAGSGVTLSSDGTDLLLNGTAIGGGGGTALELYAENPVTPTAPSATGDNAVAIGFNASASNTYAIAMGHNATASAAYAIALGRSADASGANGAALGWDSTASGTQAVALGTVSVASGTNSLAGPNSTASATNSVAIGQSALASNFGGAAFGKGATTAVNNYNVAIGNSYTSGADAFAAAIANNTASYGATGANSVAMGYQAKASGVFTTSIGYGTQATSGNAMSFGRSSLATGSLSLALGYQANASAERSVAIGSNAKAEIKGKLAYAAYDFGSSTIYSQTGIYTLLSDTTDATPEALTTNKSAASTDNQVILPNNSAYGFTGIIVARENSASTNDFAVWEIKGGAVRGATAATTELGTYNINKISESAGAANWSIALSADTTNGAVAITVTGEAAHNIRWVATINTAEVTY